MKTNQQRLKSLRKKIVSEIKPHFEGCDFMHLYKAVKMMQTNGDGFRGYQVVAIADLEYLTYDSLCALADFLTNPPKTN